jgi:hypothetical protein
MAGMKALKAMLAVYTADPEESLDLSGMGIGAEEAKTVAAFLPKW